MKKAILLFIFNFIIGISFGQLSQFKKGQTDLQFGVGLVSTLNAAIYDASNGDIKEKWTTPPVSLSIDYGVTDEISIGLYLGKAASTIKILGDEAEKDKYTIIGIRGLYHFEVHEKFDTYGGLMLGVTSLKWTQPNYFDEDDPYKGTKSLLGYQLVLGGRYRFQQNAGVFLELGYGVAIFNLGLNIKL
jgi:hypothetical protein